MPSFEESCRSLPLASFAPGEVLLAEGGATGRLYVLAEGAVEILKGGFQINVVQERGAVFGEMSVLLGIAHMASVRAITACTAHVVENSAAFLQENRDLSYGLAQLLAQRLHGVTAYLVDLKRQFADQDSHLGMVDDILESLVHEQRSAFTPGSDREPEY